MKKVLFTLCFALLCGSALAQQFPTKQVRFVSGVSPGSASDTMARLLAEKLTGKWGQPVIVENRLGAGGLVGAKYVSQSEPDGHTIMMYASAFTVSTLLSPEVLNPKDMQAAAMVATIPTILARRAGTRRCRTSSRRPRRSPASWCAPTPASAARRT
jgi:tripartite-type tricarboxylate transporter receptor subunit TctC